MRARVRACACVCAAGFYAIVRASARGSKRRREMPGRTAVVHPGGNPLRSRRGSALPSTASVRGDAIAAAVSASVGGVAAVAVDSPCSVRCRRVPRGGVHALAVTSGLVASDALPRTAARPLSRAEALVARRETGVTAPELAVAADDGAGGSLEASRTML
eukprot:6212919-Pleurochrysis_carterae.AAC.2